MRKRPDEIKKTKTSRKMELTTSVVIDQVEERQKIKKRGEK